MALNFSVSLTVKNSLHHRGVVIIKKVMNVKYIVLIKSEYAIHTYYFSIIKHLASYILTVLYYNLGTGR